MVFWCFQGGGWCQLILLDSHNVRSEIPQRVLHLMIVVLNGFKVEWHQNVVCDQLCRYYPWHGHYETRNLVLFLQFFKKCEKHPSRSVTLSKVAGWIMDVSHLFKIVQKVPNLVKYRISFTDDFKRIKSFYLCPFGKVKIERINMKTFFAEIIYSVLVKFSSYWIGSCSSVMTVCSVTDIFSFYLAFPQLSEKIVQREGPGWVQIFCLKQHFWVALSVK